MNEQGNGLQLSPLAGGRQGIRAQLGVQGALGTGVHKVGPGGGSCIDFIASTGALDRYGEVIDPAGWKLDAYRKNPVFQNAHRYGDVLHTLGKAEVSLETLLDGRLALTMRVEFATEVNPVARVAYGLYEGGFLNAVSVGFIPLEWVEGGEKDEWFRKYLKQELVEVSAVAVPANREALRLGLKTGVISAGAVSDALDVLSDLMRETALSQGVKSASREALRWARELRFAMRA